MIKAGGILARIQFKLGRLRSRVSLFFGVSLLLVSLLFFQNCGFRSSSYDGGHDTIQNVTGVPIELDWRAYQEATQKPTNDIHGQIILNYYNDHSALVSEYNVLYLYNSNDNSFRKIYSTNQDRYISDLMVFPSLGRVTVTITKQNTRTKHILVIDVAQAKIIYESDALSTKSHPCMHNTQNEASGQVLCSFDSPSANDSKEIQAAIFSVKNLTMTKLAKVPAEYSLQRGWSIAGPYIFSHDDMHPFPHENRAVVQVENSSRQEVLLLLSPNSASVLDSATKLDFDGSGVQRTFSEYKSAGLIGRQGLKAQCLQPAHANAPFGFASFADSTYQEGNRFCQATQEWYMPANGRMTKCVYGGICSEQDLSVDGHQLGNSSGKAIFLSSNQSFLIPTAFGSYAGFVLQKLNTLTGERTILHPTPVAPYEQDISEINGATIFTSMQVREYQNTLVRGYKAYFPEIAKLVDLPIVPNSVNLNAYWYQRRFVNGKNFLIGYTNDRQGTFGTIVVSDSGEYLSFAQQMIFERDNGNYLLDSPILYLREGRKIQAYNLLTKVKTNVAEVPDGYVADWCAHFGSYLGVYASGASDRLLMIFKGNQIIFQLPSNGGDLRPLRDGSGVLAWYSNSSGAYLIAFDGVTETASTPYQCSTSPMDFCFDQSFLTNEGELLSINDKVFDQKLNLIATISGSPLRTYYNPSDQKVSQIYSLKYYQDPQDPSAGLYSLYRFDVASRTEVQVADRTKEAYQVHLDHYVSYLYDGAIFKNVRIFNQNGLVLDLPNAVSFSLNSRHITIFEGMGASQTTGLLLARDPRVKIEFNLPTDRELTIDENGASIQAWWYYDAANNLRHFLVRVPQ